MNRKELVLLVIEQLKKKQSPFFSIGNCYYYRRICIDLNKGYENVFDTSTDIWRPLTTAELLVLRERGFKLTNDYLVIKNAKAQLQENRKDFHIATIKKNEKDKLKYYKKAIQAINKLREFVGY
jgi:hypothetical protein